ncbi:hypothetical protein H0H81_002897 [Sphagnurus paluster]|uniref:Mini-chromosome maintenance complex-binding protein n=1 Tax=Sphagnurus paluster TaxID=117069 RepID=A0A9P7K5L5_9AGAR|nr:hypothetical protein H0H81_002897 [Sphagnurus paluster]
MVLVDDAFPAAVADHFAAVFTNANVSLTVDPKFDYYASAEAIAARAPPPATLDAFRALIGSAKVGSVSISDATAQFIQEDFVRQRKDAQPTLSEADFIQCMLVARLLALSMQESEITQDIWGKAKSLEARRKATL